MCDDGDDGGMYDADTDLDGDEGAIACEGEFSSMGENSRDRFGLMDSTWPDTLRSRGVSLAEAISSTYDCSFCLIAFSA